MDNPSAFPSQLREATNPGDHDPQAGMTLRDYFAGQALACSASVVAVFAQAKQSFSEEQAAQMAYRIADAMLLARNTGENSNGGTAS